jgi:hypothetical protein
MMDAVDLLQQLGLNKYEADAYYTLLAQGPLTGYELGKRSHVPLSRSYEVLERLTAKGLALAQPGDPPRYAAEDAARVLGAMRAAFAQTVDALDDQLAALPPRDDAGQFWVLRGRAPILARLRALLGEARRSLDLCLPAAYQAQFAVALSRAPAGQRLTYLAANAPDGADIVLALVDGRHGLAGTLAPSAACQAIAGANPALLALLRHGFAAMPHVEASPVADQPSTPSWLDWETGKQRQLWRLSAQRRSA